MAKAAIPCKRIDKIEDQVQKSLMEVSSLMKHWRRLRIDKEPLQSFISSLDMLFDISPLNIEYQLKTSGNPDWEEDLKFLQEQKRVPQVGSMIGRDKRLEERQKRKQKRTEQFEVRQQKASLDSSCETLGPKSSRSRQEQSRETDAPGIMLRDLHPTNYAESE